MPSAPTQPRASSRDYLIVGAGCAGLSLAWHLLNEGALRDRRAILIDPRESYGRDRTWCFWNVRPHPFESLIDHRWSRWSIREGGTSHLRGAPGITYDHLSSARFYAHVLARLEAAPEVELRLGVRAGPIEARAGGVSVITDRGLVEGALAFDSRPTALRPRSEPGREVVFLQHFEGWEVEVDRPVFDPTTATLMDFDVEQSHGVHFIYVLPFGPKRALVESTFFGPVLPPPETYGQRIERYLRERLGVSDWKIGYREAGRIPMSTEAPPPTGHRHIYRIGLAGGMAKPSTGYAFQAIQSFSERFARALRDEDIPTPPEARPWLNRFQDRVMLSYLARYPDRAPKIFSSLFEHVDPTRLVRFLSDVATAPEAIDIMRNMPFTSMTHEVIRSLPLWARA